MHIWIINGPNLNLLGRREPHIYGHLDMESALKTWAALFPAMDMHYFQSNSEGALIDQLHAVGYSADGIVLNAGAYTHTSIALADAVAAISAPVVEVHISNLYAREAFRQRSYTAAHCRGLITGFGMEGYRLALQFFENLRQG